jgi:enoyl-CoA hydratase
MSIDFHVDDKGIALLRVNRPERRNALNWEAQEAFAAVVTAVATNPTIRVLIITGVGCQAFVSGGDLKELSQRPDASAGQRLYRVMNQALIQLTQLPIPVIAAVNGDAFGGGCEILTACDLRLAVPQARFSFAQIRNGLTTGWGGTGRLVCLVGHSRAMELLLTGRVIDAVEAQQIGLVHRVLDEGEEMLTAVRTWAYELASLPRYALASLKSLVYTASFAPLSSTNQREAELFTQLYAQPDHLEALQAFMEKRAPNFNRQT